jgi:hypothetical protein
LGIIFKTLPGFSAETSVYETVSLPLLRLLALLLPVEVRWQNRLMLLLMVKLLWLETCLSDRKVTQLSRVVVQRAGGDVEACPTQWRTFCLHQ